MRRWSVLIAAVLVGACSTSDGEAASTGPIDEPVVAAATGSTAPTGPTAGEPSTLEDRVEATLELDFPDRILVGFDSIWIHTDDQRELRIDPTTNQVIAEVDLSGGQCQGSGLGEGRVWACRESTLVGIDPRTDQIDLETDVAMDAGQWAIGAGEGAAWVLAGEGVGETLLRVDAQTGKAGEPIDLGHACENTAVGFGTVWVTCPADGVVVTVDAATGKILGETAVGGVLDIAVGPDAVWVGSTDPAGGLARIDPATLEITSVAGTDGPGETGTIWVEGSDVWIRSSGIFLTRVDAATMSVAEELPSAQPLGGGAVAVGFGSIWASSYDFFRVLRIAP